MWNIQKIISKGDYNYVYVPEHPKATKNGYVLEHRIVVENNLGRLLNSDEVVHHKDGNKKNNDISNLEVMKRIEHSKLHSSLVGQLYVSLKCPECGKIFERQRVQSFLVKKGKLNCNFCSNSCRGKFSRKVQLGGITQEMQEAISGNLLAEYKKYIDEENPEETDL